MFGCSTDRSMEHNMYTKITSKTSLSFCISPLARVSPTVHTSIDHTWQYESQRSHCSDTVRNSSSHSQQSNLTSRSPTPVTWLEQLRKPKQKHKITRFSPTYCQTSLADVNPGTLWKQHCDGIYREVSCTYRPDGLQESREAGLARAERQGPAGIAIR